MKKLLYTTHADLSLQYFHDWEVAYYDDPARQCIADLVYFRDPFNDPNYTPDPARIDQLIAQHQNSMIIDHLTSYNDMLQLEDKYHQSRQYKELYPQTWLPSEKEFIVGRYLAKPRISQRAKDILFELGERELDDSWIIQKLLDIKEELRVYAIGGKIIQLASVKSSKMTGSVKVIGTKKLAPQEQSFIYQALEICPLDVVGFDVAILEDGEMKIIEANRSPQFRRYTERTNINLADEISEAFS